MMVSIFMQKMNPTTMQSWPQWHLNLFKALKILQLNSIVNYYFFYIYAENDIYSIETIHQNFFNLKWNLTQKY